MTAPKRWRAIARALGWRPVGHGKRWGRRMANGDFSTILVRHRFSETVGDEHLIPKLKGGGRGWPTKVQWITVLAREA